MLRDVIMIVLVVMLAVSSTPAAMTVAGVAGAESPSVRRGETPLDRTWTTRGQEKEVGSQVLVSSSLTSPVSFNAEGKGLEPSTGKPAPDSWSGVPFRHDLPCVPPKNGTTEA